MMQCEWLGERVAAPDVGRAISNVLHSREDAGWGPNAVFRFPTQCVARALFRRTACAQHADARLLFRARGGTGGIWKGAAALLPAERKHFGAGNAVQAVDAEAKRVTLASGATVSYDSFVSTMPLDILLRKLGKDEWADGLTHSSSHIIGVGIRGAWGARVFVLLACVLIRAAWRRAEPARQEVLAVLPGGQLPLLPVRPSAVLLLL